ncbi:ABC transporter substrate-binding protein [Rubrobacter xylanophilus]|uniref:ABC transporter substrate-binding protein n=1 Tax=Rubrobacter xylanophilus TaxID=49319 RepID=A0A510HMB6_9ACTN|nr:iron-siderophore ABC transporter substrate-binding protein [Rubrobacter xylanophilus]BBL80958.1 ABC transporter substrate-binding protein [Rubrobacter xylanophilus]
MTRESERAVPAWRPEIATRREFLAGVGALLLLLSAGCAGGGGGSQGGSRAVEHRYGVTRISGRPRRVVSLGYQEHDFLYALGIKPVAVRYWYGDRDDVIYPWAEDEAGDVDPEILNMPFGQLNFEKIAALEPDLIMGVYAGLTREEYETLSEMAPTVAQPRGYVNFGAPWQRATLMAGRAVGREGRARRLVSGLERRFEEARREHPEFDGATVAVASYGNGEKIGFFSSQDARARFFTGLGFRVPERLEELARESFYGTISPERMDLLDADLLVWCQLASTEGGREAIEGDPLVRRLDASREGRVVFMEGTLDDALQFGTVLSLPFLLERAVPRIAAAVNDD